MDTGELGRDDGRAFKQQQQQQQGGRGGAVRPRCAAGLGSSTRAALTDSGSWLLLLEDAESNRSRGPPGLADGKGKRRGARPMHASTLSLGGSSLGEEFRTSHRHFFSGRSWDERPLPAQPRQGMFPSLHHHSTVQLSAGLPDHPPRTHNWDEFRPKQLTLVCGKALAYAREVVSGKPTRQTQRVSGNIILQQQRLHTRQEPSGNQS
ncbi:unnamed protein product [Lampetra planeri]